MTRRNSTNPRDVDRFISDLRYSILPELAKEYRAAYEYISGRRDRPSNDQNEYISGGGSPSDPTGDIASEQESNRDRLKRVAEGITGLVDDARSLQGRLKGIFDVSEEGPLESIHIPTIKEAQAHKDAVRAKEHERLRSERAQLERRLGEIDKTLGAAS